MITQKIGIKGSCQYLKKYLKKKWLLSRDEIEHDVAFKYGMFIQKNVQGRVNLVICRVVVELTFQKQGVWYNNTENGLCRSIKSHSGYSNAWVYSKENTSDTYGLVVTS